MNIPRFEFRLSDADIEAVSSALHAGELVTGGAISELEAAMAQLSKKDSAVAVSNGFAAMHLSIEALGVKDKKVIVPAVSTCLSFINAIRASGNEPLLVEVDPLSANLDIAKVKDAMSDSVGLILTPNHFGIPSNVQALKDMGTPVIEDSAQSAATDMVGEGTGADARIYSLYPTKMINGIDGGIVAGTGDDLIERVKEMRYYGGVVTDDGVQRYNYKLNNVNAVLALRSIEQLGSAIERRRTIEEQYSEVLAGQNINYLKGEGAVLQKFICVLDDRQHRDHFVNAMHDQGIECSHELFFIGTEDQRSAFPQSTSLLNVHASLPFHEQLTDDQVSYICDTIQKSLS